MVEIKKKELGQYFTISDYWQQPQVKKFIINAHKSNMVDFFAGGGHLLAQCKNFAYKGLYGFDKDISLGWEYNDSLIDVPIIEDAIVITNPPYLYKSSKVNTEETRKYFKHNLQDLYLEALYTILNRYDYCVAIIPGSFLKCYQKFPFYKRLNSITYISKNLFTDTTCPVCVVCFDKIEKGLKDIKCYENENYISSLQELEEFNYHYMGKVKISNDDIGWLGCKLIDDIHFGYTQEFEKYLKTNLKNRRCYIKFSVAYRGNKDELIFKLNETIDELMEKTKGLVLLPFKSSNRRRMTIEQAKGILEKVILSTSSKKIEEETKLW